MRKAVRRLVEGALFTDFYQFTMSHVYFRAGLHERRVQFDRFFRSYPSYGAHQAGYCIHAGLEWLLDWMEEGLFRPADLDALRVQRGAAGQRLFPDDFLDWLGHHGNFHDITLHAIPEGRVVHPTVPITVVQGPLAMAQVLESPLLNLLNYPTLVATKAARLCHVACGPVIDFGLRRGQERGAHAGSRAALIGGVDFTSNTGLSCALDLPPKGTHAHSFVEAVIAEGGSEFDAFRLYADVYPDDCLLLVDSVHTLESGVPNAIRVFQELRRKGHEPLGVRLDSGDLAHLAVRTARMMNEAGFHDTKIVLSNQLDELVIQQVHAQIREEAPRHGVDADSVVERLVYGVGTRLIASKGDAALDGVYKLVAVQRDNEWRPTIKISETPEKVLNPGPKSVWRLYDREGMATCDLLGLAEEDPRDADVLELCHPVELETRRTLSREEISGAEPLLVEVFRDGRRIGGRPSLGEMRALRARDEARLDPGVRRIVNPHIYHVSLTPALAKLKRSLVEQLHESGRLGRSLRPGRAGR